MQIQYPYDTLVVCWLATCQLSYLAFIITYGVRSSESSDGNLRPSIGSTSGLVLSRIIGVGGSKGHEPMMSRDPEGQDRDPNIFEATVQDRRVVIIDHQ